MAGVIKPWDQRRIAHDGWLRFAIRPADRAAGRQWVARLRAWFAIHGRGCAMIFDAVFCCDLTVAFSEVVDSVLFRLTFVDADTVRAAAACASGILFSCLNSALANRLWQARQSPPGDNAPGGNPQC